MLKTLLRNVGWPIAMIAVIIVANLNVVVGIISPVPLVYLNSPFPILNQKAIGPYDAVTLEVNRCNTRDEPIISLTARNLVNVETGDTETFPVATSIIPPGCQIYNPLIGPIGQFNHINSGRYKFQAITTVTTIYRTYNIIWETQEFYYDRNKVT